MFFTENVLLMPVFTLSGSMPLLLFPKSLSLRTFDKVSNIKIYVKQVPLHLFSFGDNTTVSSCNRSEDRLSYFDFSLLVSSENTSDPDHWNNCLDYLTSLSRYHTFSFIHSSFIQLGLMDSPIERQHSEV